LRENKHIPGHMFVSYSILQKINLLYMLVLVGNNVLFS